MDSRPLSHQGSPFKLTAAGSKACVLAATLPFFSSSSVSLQKGKLRPSEGRAHLTQLSPELGFLTRVAAWPQPPEPSLRPLLCLCSLTPLLGEPLVWPLLPPTLSQVLPVTGGRQEASWPKYIVS